jgi:hypothetical protein
MRKIRMISLGHLASLLRRLATRLEQPVDAHAHASDETEATPFTCPEDAPGMFWVRLMVDYPVVGSVKIFPTSNLKAKLSHSDYYIMFHYQGTNRLMFYTQPPPRVVEKTLRAHGFNPEDRGRMCWVRSPSKKPWSARQLLAIIGALYHFTGVDPHFWKRPSEEEVEEEPIKPVSESKVKVEGPITRREIAWLPERLDKDEDEVVWLDVAKFDELWRGDFNYIERDPNAKKGLYNRYYGVGNWIMAGKDVDMPLAGGDEYFASTGTVSFTDGTHRFSWVRDHGGRAIPVVMNKDDCAEIKRRCGTDERVCEVTYSTQDAAEALKDMKWQDKRANVDKFFKTAAMLRNQIDEAARGGDVFPLAKPDPEACRAAVSAIEAMVEALNNIAPLRASAKLFRHRESGTTQFEDQLGLDD